VSRKIKINPVMLVELAVIFVVAFLAATLLKNIFQIDRPCVDFFICDEGYSFPSRHTTVVFGLATAFSFYIRNKKFVPTIFLVAAAIGIFRVVLNLHRVEDVFGGAAIGILLAYALHRFVFKKIKL
jgi:membrane-associated phospholipid phosphatase